MEESINQQETSLLSELHRVFGERTVDLRTYSPLTLAYIGDAVFEIIEGGDSYVAEAEDVTALLGTDELIAHQNKFVSFKGMTVESSGKNADGSEAAYLYNHDGSGEDGSDLYFNVSLDGQTYTFTVESYLCDNTTDVYAAVKNLQVGDKIDMEGFLYWYEGVNPHITSVKAAE